MPNLDNWVERKEPVEIIQAWLNNPQICTVGITQASIPSLQGLAGMGKSTLAAYLYNSLDFEAKFWADVRQKPDFIVFAQKAIFALTHAIAQPLEITELIDNLVRLLCQRRCLLVVDNLETLIDEERNLRDQYYRQFFSRWLERGTKSTLLVTSQDKPQLFQGLPHWYSLQEMKVTEGLDLLKKLGIVGTEDELKTFVAHIDGHPLAIKLVAGFLTGDYNSQFSQVGDLQLEEFELADRETSRLAHNRQDDRLSWIIKQHLANLSLEQQQFLTNLSVYRLPFNSQAASYMWSQEIKPIVIEEKLQGLCDRFLLRRIEDDKFEFEFIVKKYVQQQANDLTHAHRKAIKYYQAKAKEPRSWKALVDVNEYLEIIFHYCELEQYNQANNVLDICLGFLKLGGYYTVLREIHHRITQRWQSHLQSEEQFDYAWALNRLGIFDRYLGKVREGITSHTQALEVFRQINNRNGETASLSNLGDAYYSLGEYQQAINFYQQSLNIEQHIGNRNGEAASLSNLGDAYYSLGEYQQAINFYQQSLDIRQHIGNYHEKARALRNLGHAYYSLGEYQQAIHFYQQSLDIRQDICDFKGEANSLINLANSFAQLDKKSEAKIAYENARKLYQLMGLDKNVESCKQVIANL